MQEKRTAQQTEIEQLEARIDELNHEHFERLQGLKSQYLQDKVDFQKSAHSRVQALEQTAQQEAITCLVHHSTDVKKDNRYLKRTLLSLINENKLLREQEEKFKQQNADLRRQLELDAKLSVQSRAQSRASRAAVR